MTSQSYVVKETGSTGEKHCLTQSHLQLSHMPWIGFQLWEWSLRETASSQWQYLRPPGQEARPGHSINVFAVCHYRAMCVVIFVRTQIPCTGVSQSYERPPFVLLMVIMLMSYFLLLCFQMRRSTVTVVTLRSAATTGWAGTCSSVWHSQTAISATVCRQSHLGNSNLYRK